MVFDTNGHVIPEFYEDGSSSDFINDNTLYLNDCPNLEQIKGLKNVTNIMALDFSNCVNLTSTRRSGKYVGFKRN